MPPKADTSPLKTVRCPGCGGQSIYASSNAFRPFCCERCKNMDFGAWASESFKLPEQDSQNDPEFGAS